MPSPTPTYEDVVRVFPERNITREHWESMSPIMRGIFTKAVNLGPAEQEVYKEALADLLVAGTPVPTRTPRQGGSKNTPPAASPTPTRTPSPTPTPTPTGGFAYLMDPKTQKVQRVPWAEVADLIRAGWQEVD